LRRVAFDQMHDQYGDASADEDQWCLGPEHRAKDERGQRRADDAGQVACRYRAARLESLSRMVAAGPGQIPQGQADQQAAQRQRRQRPPRWYSMEAQLAWQGGEEVLLARGDQLQEEIGDDRHRDPGYGPEYQQGQITPALDHFGRALRGRRSGSASHGPGAIRRATHPGPRCAFSYAFPPLSQDTAIPKMPSADATDVPCARTVQGLSQCRALSAGGHRPSPVFT
jgi:hypothetical protein